VNSVAMLSRLKGEPVEGGLVSGLLNHQSLSSPLGNPPYAHFNQLIGNPPYAHFNQLPKEIAKK
jgi:hypothetical protein